MKIIYLTIEYAAESGSAPSRPCHAETAFRSRTVIGAMDVRIVEFVLPGDP